MRNNCVNPQDSAPRLVYLMLDFIACPHCRRRLRLPSDLTAEIVRCPSCQADFSLESVRSTPPAPTLSSPLLQSDSADAVAGPAPHSERSAREERRDPSSRKAKKSSGSTCLIVVLIVGVLGGMITLGIVGAVLFVIALPPARTPVASHIEEDVEELMQERNEAFRDHEPLIAEELPRELVPLFDGLGEALGGPDTDAVMAFLDTDRMAKEVAAVTQLPLRSRQNRRKFALGLRQGMDRRSPLFQWKETEIRKVKKLNDEDIVVIARHKNPNHGTLKMRWWLSRRSGTWKIYDFEDLDTGLRNSTTVASLAGQGLNNMSETTRAFKAVAEALQILGAQEDADAAEKKLQEAAGVKLPPQMEALRFLVIGMVHLQRGKLQESLTALEEAHRLYPDMPVVDFQRGRVCNQLGQREKALKHLQAYGELLGEDEELCFEQGEALRWLRRFREAAAAYRKALDFNPKAAGAFEGLLSSLGPEDDKADIGPRFAKLDFLRENFDLFAEDCEKREFAELLAPLIEVIRKKDPKYPPVDYYAALVKARSGHAEEAIPLFKSSLARQDNEATRRAWTERFLKAMASAGQYTAAYAALADSTEAFRILAAMASQRYQTGELKKLLAAHRAKQPADPLPAWYQAEIYFREGRSALADKTFTAARARPPDEETLKSFRRSMVLARYHTGQALSAYREIAPREETFRQLAEQCLLDKNFSVLQNLLDEHVRNDPRSLDVLRFRARLKARQKKAAEAVALFKEALAKKPADDVREAIISEFLMDLVDAGEPLEAYRAAPDARKGFQLLAEQLLDEDRTEDLRRLIEAHRQKHTDDPWLAFYQAEIHQHDKAWDRAAQVLKEGMKNAPEEVRERFRSNYVHSMFLAGRGLQAYTDGGERAETFRQLAELMTDAKKKADLEALIEAHRPHARDDADLFYYEARARILAKRPAEAIALYQKAYRQQKVDYLRHQYTSRFLLNMSEAGHILEGYRAVADKSAAFEVLASNLVLRKKDKELEALLQEHGAGRGQDPAFEFYTGQVRLLRGDAAGAEPHLAAAVARGAAKDQWRFRQGLFKARVKLGRAAATYEQFKQLPGTFGSLASLCKEKKDAAQLKQLLDASRRDQADDAELWTWELERLWLQHDYEGVLKLLTERREQGFRSSRFSGQADDYGVRCLVKLKRTAEAIREAEAAVKSRAGDSLLLILARAASGDVEQTLAALGAKPHPYLLKRCYEDEDLGPILRSEAFQAFRAKHPKPPEEPDQPRE